MWWIFLLLTFPLLIQAISSQNYLQLVNEAPIRYVRGVYEIPEPPNSLPVIYDGYVPLVFEFTLPKWDAETMKIQFWKDHNNCTESDSYESGYPCPVMHHMNTLIDNFVGNMTLWNNMFMGDAKTSGNKETLEDSEELLDNPGLNLPLTFTKNQSHNRLEEYYCAKIAPHFATTHTTRVRVIEYYKLLTHCDFSNLIKIKLNMANVSKTLEDSYHKTFETFVSNYWEKLGNVPRQAAVLNMWTSLQTTLLLHQFMETERWTKAIESCQNQLIPWPLVDHEMILDAIHRSLVSHYRLAIPLREISKYFKLPLTDCVFIDKDVLLVRVLIPTRMHAPDEEDKKELEVTKKIHPSNPYKMIKYEPIIFHGDGEFCWIDDIKGKRFITDSIHPENLHVTECSSDQEQKLCLIPLSRYSTEDAADPCAQALHMDSEPDIVKYCKLKCVPWDGRPVNYKFFNLAHTTDDNFIYALGEDDSGLTLNCRRGRNNEPFKMKRLGYGAWNMTLPCHCEVTSTRHNLGFEIAPPCHYNFSVEIIKPYHWRNMTDGMKNGTSSTTSTTSSSPRFPTSNPNNYFKTFKTEEQFLEFMDQRYQAYKPHYILLWLSVLILCGMMGVLIYFVLQLRRWREHEIFKESRLIYSNISVDREDFRLENSVSGNIISSGNVRH